jgi:hypothetical protein
MQSYSCFGGGGQKSMAMSKRTKVIFLAILIVFLGFWRDYFFVNVNWIFMTITNGRPNQALDEFHFLLNWTPSEINNLKWLLTFIFTALFLLVTYLIVHIEFRNKLYTKITLVTYILITAVALGLYLLSHLTGMNDKLYGVIRTLMGIVQSFMPLMILYILFKFFPVLSPPKSE